LHLLSDLHIEQADFEPPVVDADAVVLGGDIGVDVAGVEWARTQFPDHPVLYLAGNHEFYGATLPGLIPRLRAAAAGSNVHVLENDEIVIGGVRFLGATLWSDFDIAGADQRELSMRISGRAMNDYRVIRFDGDRDGDGAASGVHDGDRVGEGEHPLAPEDTRAVHLRSRAWLTGALERPFDGPTVVLTHHQPLIIGEPPASPVLRALGGAFVSDLTSLMRGDQVALWVYGHTHRPADLERNGTRVISNPRGYPHESVPGFDPGMVVEV
jgi:predicted phosphodiesterase